MPTTVTEYTFSGGNIGGEGIDSLARTQISDIASTKLLDYTYNISALKKIRSKKHSSAIAIGDSIWAGTAAANNFGAMQQLIKATQILQNNINYENISFYYNSNVNTWTKEETGICKLLLSSKTGSTNMQLFAYAWNIPQATYTVQVVYSKRPDGGTFQIGYGSSSSPTILDTINCSGTAQDGVISTTYNIPAGGQNCYLIPTDGQKAYINNVIVVRDTTKPYYAFDNWSVGGRKAKDYTTAELITMLTYLPKDLLIWELLTNDYSGGDYAAYVNRTESVMATAKSLGMDILIPITCGNNGTPSDPQWTSKWKAYLYDVAKRYNAAVIDYDALFSGFTNAKALGLIADSIHPTDLGHLLMGNEIVEPVLGVENPYNKNQVPCTTDSRLITYGALQDNRNIYYPGMLAFDTLYAKILDGNGNAGYALVQPIINNGTSPSSFPKYAPRGSFATSGQDVYMNTTDWGPSKNVLATWTKIYARPKAELLTSLPTATSGLRGFSVLIDGNGSTDDQLYTCIKKADGSYVWKQTAFV